MSMNEADTRYHLIDPVLRTKGYASRDQITLETILTPPPVEPTGAKGRRRKGPADKEYPLFALRAPKARKHIEHHATGTSDSMRNIAQGVITSVPIDLPSLSDQRRIDTCLKDQLAEVDVARNAARKQLRDIDALPTRLLAQAFDPAP